MDTPVLSPRITGPPSKSRGCSHVQVKAGAAASDAALASARYKEWGNSSTIRRYLMRHTQFLRIFFFSVYTVNIGVDRVQKG